VLNERFAAGAPDASSEVGWSELCSRAMSGAHTGRAQKWKTTAFPVESGCGAVPGSYLMAAGGIYNSCRNGSTRGLVASKSGLYDDFRRTGVECAGLRR
jgi:hypothetical protein